MEFVVQETSDGVLFKPKEEAKREKTLTSDDLVGIVEYKGPRVSIREMNLGYVKKDRKRKRK